jgi:response regulator of citrate/malate metabolism
MRELAIQVGFAAYLVKPVQSDRLLQVLNALLSPVGSC